MVKSKSEIPSESEKEDSLDGFIVNDIEEGDSNEDDDENEAHINVMNEYNELGSPRKKRKLIKGKRSVLNDVIDKYDETKEKIPNDFVYNITLLVYNSSSNFPIEVKRCYNSDRIIHSAELIEKAKRDVKKLKEATSKGKIIDIHIAKISFHHQTVTEK